MTKSRKKYSNQFKIDAVKLVLEQGYKVIEAARSLEIHPNMLRKWKREFEDNQEKAFDSDCVYVWIEKERISRIKHMI